MVRWWPLYTLRIVGMVRTVVRTVVRTIVRTRPIWDGESQVVSHRCESPLVKANRLNR